MPTKEGTLWASDGVRDLGYLKTRANIFFAVFPGGDLWRGGGEPLVGGGVGGRGGVFFSGLLVGQGVSRGEQPPGEVSSVFFLFFLPFLRLFLLYCERESSSARMARFTRPSSEGLGPAVRLSHGAGNRRRAFASPL